MLKRFLKLITRRRCVEFASSSPNLTVSQKGELAKQIIGNPLYKEVIAKMEDELQYLWLNSHSKDTEGRERVWNTIQMLKKIDQQFTGFISAAVCALKQKEESTTSENTESAEGDL